MDLENPVITRPKLFPPESTVATYSVTAVESASHTRCLQLHCNASATGEAAGCQVIKSIIVLFIGVVVDIIFVIALVMITIIIIIITLPS